MDSPAETGRDDPDPADAGHHGGGEVRVGDRVRVRRQRWLIVGRQQYDECQLLTLSGLGVQNAGVVRRFVSPFDLVESLEHPTRPRVVSLRRWRRLCRSALARHGPAGALRAAGRARIDLLAHQLEPALALVGGLGSRVLLADEVGLGKTIQAGLAISELRHRGAAERVLVLTPAGLREQWAGELAGRFGLDPALVDMGDARRRAAMLPVGLNPWSTIPLAVASIDYVKRPEVLPAVTACRWDVVVVDEAHGVTSGSDRYEAAAAICGRAPYVLLLTATPHSGDHRAFLSLCNLGVRDHDPLIVFRRTRREVALGAGRRVHRLMVRLSAEERRMHELLAVLAREVRADRGDRDRDAWLALTILHKRAFSSPHSLERSLIRRLSVLGSPGSVLAAQLMLPLEDPAGDLDPADEPPLVRAPLLADARHERRLLLMLADAARAATTRETKLARLVRFVGRLTRMRESAIIFTEYRDTLLHLERALPNDCAILHGGLTRAERRAALDDFAGGRRSILLATDAAGEGLNLQSRCRLVINLELPWNPMRLEQRVGRVDRIGQKRTVHAVHLVALDTGEIRILQRLRARIAQARADVGAANPLGRMSAADEFGEFDESVEEATARFVIYNSKSEPTEQTPPAVENRELSFIRLTREAAAEQVRLTRQRSWGSSATEDETVAAYRGALLARTRRLAMRALLGRRALVLMQTVCEDACGRHVATYVSPLLVDAGTASSGPAGAGCYSPTREPYGVSGFSRTVGEPSVVSSFSRTLHDLLRTLEARPLHDIDPGLREWESETLRLHRDFWTRRLVRERAIARILLDGEAGTFQPGLFDRRADRDQRATAHDHDELREELARRMRIVESTANATIRAARSLLVMVGRGRP